MVLPLTHGRVAAELILEPRIVLCSAAVRPVVADGFYVSKIWCFYLNQEIDSAQRFSISQLESNNSN